MGRSVSAVCLGVCGDDGMLGRFTPDGYGDWTSCLWRNFSPWMDGARLVMICGGGAAKVIVMDMAVGCAGGCCRRVVSEEARQY